MNRKFLPVFVSTGVALLSLVAISPVAASIDLYTTLGAFNAAAPGSTTITFDGIANPNDFVSYGSNGSVTLSGVTFQGNGQLFITDTGYFGLPTGNGVLNSSYSATNVDTITTIVLPNNTYAVATNYGSLFGTVGGLGVTATLDDGTTVTYNLGDYALTPDLTFDPNAIDGLGFVGFVSTTPINQINYVAFSASQNVVLDNFQYAIAPAVQDIPEPGAVAFALLASGTTLGLALRKRNN